MIRLYKLCGETPVPCKDSKEWATWFETSGKERTVAKTTLIENGKEIEISTVFLGINHRFSNEGSPLLFETMVFRREKGEDVKRYCTWLEAQDGHKLAVACIEAQGATIKEG